MEEEDEEEEEEGERAKTAGWFTVNRDVNADVPTVDPKCNLGTFVADDVIGRCKECKDCNECKGWRREPWYLVKEGTMRDIMQLVADTASRWV